MKQWWIGLQASERRTLTIGGVFVLLTLIYLGAWEPFANSMDSLEKQVNRQKADKAWMEQSAAEVKQLRSRAGGNRKPVSDGRSLLALADSSLKRRGLGPALKRTEPEGNKAVRIWLEDATFDDMIQWLLELEKNNGVSATVVAIDRQKTEGKVNARLTLRGAG